jgi:hypothetical protein
MALGGSFSRAAKLFYQRQCRVDCKQFALLFATRNEPIEGHFNNPPQPALAVIGRPVYESSMPPAQHCEGAWAGWRYVARRQENPKSDYKFDTATRRGTFSEVQPIQCLATSPSMARSLVAHSALIEPLVRGST